MALHDAAAIALIAVPRAALRSLARRCALGGTGGGIDGAGTLSLTLNLPLPLPLPLTLTLTLTLTRS